MLRCAKMAGACMNLVATRVNMCLWKVTQIQICLKHPIILMGQIKFPNIAYVPNFNCGAHVTPNFKDKIVCNILCVPRDQSHISQQIIWSIITSVYYITVKSQSLYTNIEEIKHNSRVEAPSHRHVNWLTTSLEILREVLVVVITHAICYPSRIFIQIDKINKHKYISY